MVEWLWFGVAGAAGALVRSILGYINVKADVDFDWKKFLSTSIPATAAAFAVAILVPMTFTAQNLILIGFGAAGFGSVQSKFGLK